MSHKNPKESEDKYEVIHKKRNRSPEQKKANECFEITSQKKFKSADANKKRTIKDIDEVKYFMAMIRDDYGEQKSQAKLIGDELNFKFRKKKALELINLLSLENNDKNEGIIENAFMYDNTNKYVIYKSLEYYYHTKNKIKFEEILNNSKFCITKKLLLNIDGEKTTKDLDSFYDINIPLQELEELPNLETNYDNIKDLRNKMVSIFTDYYYLSESYIFISKIIDNSNRKDLNIILSVKYEKNKKTELYEFNFEHDKKQEIINKYKKDKNYNKFNDFPQLIQNFLSLYLYSKELENFDNNQPITYDNNLTLFYNYLIYSLYSIVIDVDEKNLRLKFKTEKFHIYNSLDELHNLIFDKFFDKAIPVNETLVQLLNYFLLALSYKGKFKSFYYLINYIHIQNFAIGDKFLNEESSKELIKCIKKNKMDAKIVKKKIIMEDSRNFKFEFNYPNYSIELLNYAQKGSILFDIIYKEVKFENFQHQNFFFKEDIIYLKFLIRHILSSKLLKQIFENFNNISELYDYYFNNEDNKTHYINNIIFLPFKASDFGLYGLTDKKTLSILIAGFPEKSITNITFYLLNRIVELALRAIAGGIHEPGHYIKCAYNILSNGKIQRNTTNTKENNRPEAGFLLEEILFGWIQNEDNPINLDIFKIPKDIKIKNKMIQNKKINLSAAIKLLDPKTYDGDVAQFRRIVFESSNEELKSFSFNSLEKTYKKYLKSFISEDTIKNNWDNDITINASMGLSNNVSIDYISSDHRK